MRMFAMFFKDAFRVHQGEHQPKLKEHCDPSGALPTGGAIIIFLDFGLVLPWVSPETIL